jgi:hypothetical protein
MHVGHFAAGMIAKRFDPKLSLGTCVFAAILADLLWCIFMMAGIEQIELKAGPGAANYFEPHNIVWSHSLLTNVVWATVLAGAYYFCRRNIISACLLFTLVLSHWVLDVVAHKPDMPLAPGVESLFGLGLWTNIPATIIVEGGLWVLGTGLYLRATRPKNRLAHYVFWSMLVLLTLSWYNNIAGPPPPNAHTVSAFSFIYFSLVVAWAYWLNRLRPTKT